jgi:signal peptidase I
MADQTEETVIIKSKKAPKQKKPWYKEWSEALIFAAILAIIIRTFVIQAFKIPSGSMEDTLLIGDHLMVSKFIYGTQIPFTDTRILTIRDPERGDIIVFEYPLDKDKSYFKRKDFIKRVVGLPGDRVKMVAQTVYVNDEPFVIPQAVHKGAQGISSRLIHDFPEVLVPEDKYFVMGDNRDRSADSRFWGFVPEENIKGLAFIKYWSWNSVNNSVRWSRIGSLIN